MLFLFKTSQIMSFYDLKTEKEEVVISAEIWTADLLRRKLMHWPLDQGAAPKDFKEEHTKLGYF